MESSEKCEPRIPTRAGCLVLLFSLVALASCPLPAQMASSPAVDSTSQSIATYYVNAVPYIDEPVKQLVKRVPQLKDLRPVADQQDLPVILQKTGERVDDFFRHIIDLTAREDVTLTRLKQDLPTSRPELLSERVRDSYLILRHRNQNRFDIIEYRTNARGDNFDQALVKQGYVVTSGFALSCNYFSTGFQSESRFRYLGDARIGAQDAYVVGFAQQPGKATLSVRTRGRSGTPTQMLVQGIAWIDKSNFQVVRLRTDLLAPRWDVGLNQETTEVTLSKVQLADIAAPLWLPSNVKVFVEFTTHNGDVDEVYELSYQNEHRYSDYQRYRVAAKVVP